MRSGVGPGIQESGSELLNSVPGTTATVSKSAGRHLTPRQVTTTRQVTKRRTSASSVAGGHYETRAWSSGINVSIFSVSAIVSTGVLSFLAEIRVFQTWRHVVDQTGTNYLLAPSALSVSSSRVAFAWSYTVDGYTSYRIASDSTNRPPQRTTGVDFSAIVSSEGPSVSWTKSSGGGHGSVRPISSFSSWELVKCVNVLRVQPMPMYVVSPFLSSAAMRPIGVG